MKKLTAILMTLCLLAGLPVLAAAEAETEGAETTATLLDIVRGKIEDAADLVVMTEDDLFEFPPFVAFFNDFTAAYQQVEDDCVR